MKPSICFLFLFNLVALINAQGLKDSSLLKSNKTNKFTGGVKDSSFKTRLPSFKSDSLKKQKIPFDPKIKLPKSRLFAFHGNASMDLYYADVQNPRQLNQNQYARIYLNPTINIMGLPFTSNVFLTTENNNFFNSNSISVRFDAQAYQRQLKEKYTKQWQEEQKKLGSKNNELFKSNKLLEQQKRELEKQKKEMSLLDGMAKKELETAKQKVLQRSRDSLNKVKSNTTEAIQDSITNQSAKEIGKTQQTSDSIQKIREKQRARIAELNAKIEQFQKRQDSIKEQIHYHKQQVEKYSTLMKDPMSAIGNSEKELKDSLGKMKKGYTPNALDLEQFDVGLFYANQTELTTSGLPVKGINVKVSPNKFVFGLGGGKTMSSFNSITKNKQEFNRNVALLTLGYQFSKTLNLTMNGGSLWDEIKPNTARKTNLYSSLTLEQEFKDISIKAEVAYSKIQSDGQIENVVTQGTNKPYLGYRLTDQLAYKTKAQYNALKNAVISGSFTKVPLNYMTLGNPYMRRDYREYEVTYKQKWFKNKLQTEVFFKENKNNLNKFETYTTRAKGYGITLQTNFSSTPNLSLSYLPYTMGNNHPDSALQTRSQFSVLNAVLTYAYFRSKFMWNSMFMVSQSQAELAPGQLSGNILLSGNQNFDYNGKLNINIICNASRFQFISDTLNFNQYKFTVGFKPSKKIQPLIGGEYVLYKNGASKTSAIAGLNFKIKKSFTFRLNYSFMHLQYLWGFENKYAQQAKCTLLFNW